MRLQYRYLVVGGGVASAALIAILAGGLTRASGDVGAPLAAAASGQEVHGLMVDGVQFDLGPDPTAPGDLCLTITPPATRFVRSHTACGQAEEMARNEVIVGQRLDDGVLLRFGAAPGGTEIASLNGQPVPHAGRFFVARDGTKGAVSLVFAPTGVGVTAGASRVITLPAVSDATLP